MENDKSASLDRVRIELYKELCELLENNFLQLYNYTLFIEQKSIKTMN